MYRYDFEPLLCLSSQGAMQGTIPYLGTFLTDLTMLDTARSDLVEVSLTIILLLLFGCRILLCVVGIGTQMDVKTRSLTRDFFFLLQIL